MMVKQQLHPHQQAVQVHPCCAALLGINLHTTLVNISTQHNFCSTESPSTTSAGLNVNTTSTSIVSETTISTYESAGTTLTEISTTLDTSSATSSPADGSKSATTSSDKDSQTVTVHLKLSVLPHNGENKDALLEAISNFVSQALLPENCEGCTGTIRHIKST
ncbi:hypothetical protein D5F01_LYC10555 [Larimichthys crocea]|uniref:Uncharacterized protein n=1 Tax=Larimichthys crocea TaxID=215358 RepID=A0A6G0II31_LARCR|nr:hypothetical protein D5F01_LYC10555 [Larimichthys crocea]